MDDKDENPYVPHFITYKDVARIENKTLSEAKAIFWRIRKKYGILRGFPLPTEKYCLHRGTNQKAIAKFFTKRFLPVWIAIATALTLASSKVIIKNYFPELDEYMKRHFIFWDYISPNHQHGHLYIKMPETEEKKKVTIDVYRTKNSQLPDWQKKFYDTVKPQNAEYPKNIPKR